MLRRARSEPVAAVQAAGAQLEQPAHAGVALGRRAGVPQQQLEQADEVVRVPLARGVRLAEAELAARREAAEEAPRSWIASRTGGPLPKRRASPSGSVDLERAALEAGERALEHGERGALEQRGRAAAARLGAALLTSAPTPRPARTAACGGTARA